MSILVGDFEYQLNENDRTAIVTRYNNGDDGDVLIQSSINVSNIDYRIISIGFRAFYKKLGAMNIIIPDTVTSIEDNAFESSGTIKVTIPNSVTNIGNFAFVYCNQLYEINIIDGPKNVYIGYNAFVPAPELNYYNLRSVTIPKSVTSIGDSAFSSIEYAYIQGNDENYTDIFSTALKVVFYDKNSKITKSYPQISQFTTPTVSVKTDGIIVSSLFDVNPNPLSATLTYIVEGDELLIDFPGYTFVSETVLSTDSGTYTLTIALDNIIFVNLPVVVSEPIVLSSQLGMSKNTYTINTKTEFKILKKLIERNPNKLFPIKRIIDTLFTSLSREKYQKITTTYGLYSTNLNLDELADLGQNTLIVLPTRLITITVGDKSLTSNGTDTFVSGERLAPGDSFITKFKNRDFNITLVANGSSAITIEKIETSPICFPAGTPILTNQGYIPIDKITTQTLHNKPIQLTKTISTDKYLVCFEKDSLEKNVPFQRTIISKDHMVYYKDFSLKAKDMIPYFDGVYKIKYKGEVLYNVLLDIHGKMKVNNMTCETLDPKHKMAKLYNLTTKEREDMIVVWKKEKKERTQMKFK
jgi:hypothetical protein